jgi:hypothetical protein
LQSSQRNAPPGQELIDVSDPVDPVIYDFD